MASKIKEFQRNPGNMAFAYYRYSSDAQRDCSIEQQRDAAREFAERHGYIIAEEFEDRAKTGTSLDRAGLQSMLYEMKHKRPAYLILWKLDRLAREIHDSFYVDAQLRDMGVQIVTIAETLPEDEGMRMAIQGLYASMNHNYILTLQANVKRGMLDNAKKGLYNGRKVLGYTGEKDSPYKIDEDTAPIVRKIFTDYVAGKPFQVIANELNSAGVKTSRGNKFVVNSLANIIRNRAYIGEYKWGDEVLIPDGMPRIIDDDLFEAAQKMLDKNKRGGRGAAKKLEVKEDEVIYWLGGHLYCGECGETMQGVSGTSKSGNKYYYYSCKGHRKHKCSLKNQKKDLVEELVLHLLNLILNDTEKRMYIAIMCYEYYLRHNTDGGAYLESLKNSVADIDKKLKNFTDAIAMGIFNETTAEAMRNLENQKKMLNNQIEEEKLKQEYQLRLEDIVKYFDSFVGNLEDEDIRRRVLDIFVEKIYTYPDKLVVVFHFDEDKREIPFEETKMIIQNQKNIMSMIDNDYEVSSGGLTDSMKSIIADGEDFFGESV